LGRGRCSGSWLGNRKRRGASEVTKEGWPSTKLEKRRPARREGGGNGDTYGESQAKNLTKDQGVTAMPLIDQALTIVFQKEAGNTDIVSSSKKQALMRGGPIKMHVLGRLPVSGEKDRRE